MSTDASAGLKSSATGPSSISPVLRRRLQQCYEHGVKLMQQDKPDRDYTHSILVECVLNDPGNLQYVEAMLTNLQLKYRNNRRGALIKGFGRLRNIKKAAAKKDWPQVLHLGPALLRVNPWDVVVLRAMAEACAELGFQDVELRYLKNALDANPKSAAINRHCAMSLGRIGQFDQAISCWTRVDEILRGDDQAQKMISELQIEKTRNRGRAAHESPRHHANKAPATPVEETAPVVEKEPVRREIRLTPRQQLEQEVMNRPTDAEAYFALVQLHLDEGRFGDAMHVLNKALTASGNSIRVQERIEDVEILRKKHQLAAAEQQSVRPKSEEPEDQDGPVAQLRSELQRMELDVFQRRSDRYPHDLEIKFQLGLRLKQMDKAREAIPCFEAATGLAPRRALSLLEIGECWQRLKQYGKSLDFYRRAAEKSPADQMACKKMALYRAGVLAVALHNLEAAESFFRQLIDLEPGYKDAATRLDKIREIRHKG
jgi:tetratricopeptide (TPR) repeat protein